jgi:hypothetical protein
MKHDPIRQQAAREEMSKFYTRVEQTGIGQHLTGEALIMLFLCYGDRMWRKP